MCNAETETDSPGDEAMAGIFFAVVGASGVGKDSILEGARARLEIEGSFYFPTRLITRPADMGGEDHHSISNADFVQAVRDDKFSLWWSAHELHYALPDDVYDKLRQNTHVVANISRRMVEETIVRFNRVEVIEITASREIIRDRLMARGRESEAEIMVRQLREISPGWAANAHVTQIKNEGTLDEAVESFVDAVVRLSTHAVQHVRRA